MTRLFTLIYPGEAQGTTACISKDSSVGMTISAPWISTIHWEQMVFPSYFFFLPISLALNKNWWKRVKVLERESESFSVLTELSIREEKRPRDT